jgi:hypothetical protein
MTTIISQTTANSMFIHGVYFNGENFVDRYNHILKSTWVVLCFWTNENSKHGCDIANVRTEKFCNDYKLENKMW